MDLLVIYGDGARLPHNHYVPQWYQRRFLPAGMREPFQEGRPLFSPERSPDGGAEIESLLSEWRESTSHSPGNTGRRDRSPEAPRLEWSD